MKLLKKSFMILATGLLIDLVIFTSVTNAINTNPDTNKTIELQRSDKIPSLLKYDNDELGTNHMYYIENGIKHPAYAINRYTHINDYIAESYTAEILGITSDAELLKVIQNGYPYVSISDLLCANEQEAFTATQYALFCASHPDALQHITSVGEAGARVLSAINLILSNAHNSPNITINSSNILNTMVYSKVYYNYIIAKKEEVKKEINTQPSEPKPTTPIVLESKKLPVTGC